MFVCFFFFSPFLLSPSFLLPTLTLPHALVADNAIEVIDDEGLDLLLSLMEKTDDERLLSGIVHTISNIANSGKCEEKRWRSQLIVFAIFFFLLSEINL
jgi:hypothetical protein